MSPTILPRTELMMTLMGWFAAKGCIHPGIELTGTLALEMNEKGMMSIDMPWAAWALPATRPMKMKIQVNAKPAISISQTIVAAAGRRFASTRLASRTSRAVPAALTPRAMSRKPKAASMMPPNRCVSIQAVATAAMTPPVARTIMPPMIQGVFLPPIKEIHFLDSIYVDGHDKWIEASFAKRSKILSLKPGYFKYFKRLRALDRSTDAWYAAVFEHPKAESRITGEITPAYSILPPAGI